jgi:hypothetical protein
MHFIYSIYCIYAILIFYCLFYRVKVKLTLLQIWINLEHNELE